MTWFKFYISYAVNYSDKSVCVSFGFTNKKGEFKESGGYFVPKKAIKEIDLQKRIITLAGWYYSKMGFIWRYRIDKAHAPPPRLETQDSFNPKSIQYKYYAMHSMQGIKVIE